MNTTIPLVYRTPPQLKTPQIMDNPSATITPNTHYNCSLFQNRFYPQNVAHQWTSRSCDTNNLGMKIRTLPELSPLHDNLLDSEKDRWLNHTFASEASDTQPYIHVQRHIEDDNVGKDFGSVNYQFYQPAATKVSRTTPIMELLLIELANVANRPKQVHHPPHNDGRTDHGLK